MGQAADPQCNFQGLWCKWILPGCLPNWWSLTSLNACNAPCSVILRLSPVQWNECQFSNQSSARLEPPYPQKEELISASPRRLLRYGLALGFSSSFSPSQCCKGSPVALESWRSSIFWGRMEQFSPVFTWLGMLFGIWYALVTLVTLVPQNVFFDVKNILERFR